MAKNYEVKAKVDMSQHHSAFQRSALDVYKYEKQVNSARRELNMFNRNVNGTIGGIGNLSAAFGKGNIMGFASQLQMLVPSIGGVTSGLGNLSGSLGMLANPAGIATAAVAGLGAVLVSSISKVSEFETHLDSLQSLTGLDDSGMKAISDAAIEMSKTFPASASEIVDSMKLIGSQAPELLKNKDALLQVTEAANTLAGAAQIEVVDAAKAITTTMNQMGVSGAEANDIINVLAAASQQGAADVSYLNTAFEKAGTAAASAGMNYTQLAAMVETVAPKFSSADVAGSQLASTMLKLSTQANDNFKPAVVGIQQALDNLAAAQLNDAELKKLVGESNITMVKTLIQAKDQFAAYSQSLAGTNTAQEQFATNQDNLQGAINKLKGTWEAFLLTLGESGVVQGIIASLQEMIVVLGDVINKVSDTIKIFDDLKTEGGNTINFFTLQLQLFGKIVDVVFTALQMQIRMAVNIFNWMKDAITSAWNSLKSALMSVPVFSGLINAVKYAVQTVIEWINKIIDAWNYVKKSLGMGGQTGRANTPSTPESTVMNGTNPVINGVPYVAPIKTPVGGGGGGKAAKGGKGGKGGGTPKPTTAPKPADYQANSEAAFEDNIRKWNEQLKKQNLTLEEQSNILALIVNAETELSRIRKQRESVKAEYEITDKFGADIVDKYKEVTGNNLIDPDFFKDVKTRDEAQKKIQDFLNSIHSKLPVNVELKKPKNTDVELPNLREQQLAPLKALQEKYDKGWIDRDSFLKEWDRIKSYLESLGIKVTITPKVEESALNATLNGAADVLGNFGEAFSNFGQMAEDNALSAAGIIAQAIANMWLGYAQATAQAGKLGPWGWAAFAAAGLAQTLAVISQIHSSARYAEGGIVGGKTRIGDYNIARVNGGEMILNGQQQNNLWNAISKNRLGSDGATLVASDVKIKGSDLYLALSNYGKIKNKAGHKLKFD